MSSTDLRQFRGRRFSLDPIDYPDLAGRTFEVFTAQYAKGTTTVFVSTKDCAGRLRWFREDELQPAPAPPEQRQELTMSHEHTLISLAATIAAKNPTLSYADAMKRAGQQLAPVVQAWRESIRYDASAAVTPAGSGPGPMTTALAVQVQAKVAHGLDQQTALEGALAEMTSGFVTPPVRTSDGPPAKAVALSLSAIVAKQGETFDGLAQRIADEHGLPLREAAHLAGLARPDLAAAR